MAVLISIAVVVFVAVIYFWLYSGDALYLWYLSQVKVETWKFEPDTGLWRKVPGECTLEEWLLKNEKSIKSIDRSLFEQYANEVWLVWEGDPGLPLPAALQEKEKLDKISTADMYGPWP